MFLVLLDLSTAFNTVDQQLLLSRLEHRVRLNGQALDWAKSYLTSRIQYVLVAGSNSELRTLSCDIPQDSVLGQIFFTTYTLPLSDIGRKYDLSFHLYTDDTQLYLSFDHKDHSATQSAINILEDCILKIQQWMLVNKLKLNGNKIEFIQISNKSCSTTTTSTLLKVGTGDIHSSQSANKNLGVIFDSEMSLTPQVQALCKTDWTTAILFHMYV